MKTQEISYNEKHYEIPILSTEGGIHLTPQEINLTYNKEEKLFKELNTPWNLKKFKEIRMPISFGKLSEADRKEFTALKVVRVLDIPIKFPGTDYRIPKELKQFQKVIQWVADVEAKVNPYFDNYYCYLTIDQGKVQPDTLQREAPCHVDGFQGARWPKKTWINHTYTLTNTLPTLFYPQVFDLDKLDIAKHDFFWEFNRQVALTNSKHAIHFEDFELVLMNAYNVHRGVEATKEIDRTWIRLSFETRIFDRLGNAHNPLFDYNWKMIERDIEQLHLTAHDPTSDPSLRVFPWETIDGSINPHGIKTKPKLKPLIKT